eukprot:TRINITY_DN14012_c0_g1_i1.p1 TRINITY_DN14012_c0_g1~~TRINITY_DN14012_c0_g1_i1.p1  ORF type:complete len:139 (+),score=21.26 TRINITY_DN14012_c0_g1_i1:134-550(+)
MSDFSAVFQDQQQINRRTTPHSGGNAEKHRANKAELHGGHRGAKSKYHDELCIDDFLKGTSFERQGAAATTGSKREQVITDNVEEIEKKMWESAPPQGDYKLEDAWDQAYKDMMKDDDGVFADGTTRGSDEKDDEFDF